MIGLAMDGDGKQRPQRRPRAVARPRLPPGPLAALKALLYELYLAAGTPSLDEITAWVAEDDDLPGAPGRDTVSRIIGGSGLPPSQADVVSVTAVLARAARQDRQAAVGRARELWFAAWTAAPVGVPLDQVEDPFALEVHRPIAVRGGGGRDQVPALLPPYVWRYHDDLLARVVGRAIAGTSEIAILVAPSSAGKTRALWEALGPVRQAGGWRLWHPYDPTRPDAALEAMGRAGPRTVVWLNETQEYLAGEGGERVAAGLRSLLTDSTRVPVLVLGTLWPDHHAVLTHNPASQVKAVLEGSVIEVPDAFTGIDLTAMRRAARGDPRLAMAVERAEDGHIAQYLAGGPEVVERFLTAPAPARAVIAAAMDARRMGHRSALPYALLAEAAPAYLTDAQWDQLDEDWLQQALEYVGKPCKGARGPVTLIRPRTAHPAASGRAVQAGARGIAISGEAPAYRLADYLDQYGRLYRAGLIPPMGWWTAAAVSAHPGDLHALGHAACDRGLFRDAAQLFKNATASGDVRAARSLVHHLNVVCPGDHRPAAWVADAALTLDSPSSLADLLQQLRVAGEHEQLARLAERAVDLIILDRPSAVAALLRELLAAGLAGQCVVLADRAVGKVSLDHPSAVAELLSDLAAAAAYDQLEVLADRAADQVVLDDPSALARLLRELRAAGADRQVAVLLDRLPAAHVTLGNPVAIARLLRELRAAGAPDQTLALLERNPAASVTVNDPSAVARLERELQAAGAYEQAGVLRARASAHYEQCASAEQSDPVPDAESALTSTEERAAVPDACDAAHVTIKDPSAVASLLRELRGLGASEQAAVLLGRDPGSHVAIDDLHAIAGLLHELGEAGAREQVTVLAGRAAAHGTLRNQHVVAELWDALRDADATEQLDVLASRLPAAGLFYRFMAIGDNRTRFWFGREQDATPTAPWSWDDLV